MPADVDLDMTLRTRAADRFDPLSEAERKLLAALPAGRNANCGPDGLAWDAPENDPARADAWDYDRTIRAALLAWLCADAKATEQIHRLGIRVTGARIDGVFDLSFVNVPFPLSFGACSWPQGMRLRGAVIPELRLPRCRIGPLPPGEGWNTAIVAAGLRVQNAVFLSDGFQAEGEVRLDDADIGTLDCSRGSRFENANGPALTAARAKIGGPVLLRDDFQAEGEVRLDDANIGGLECSRGSRFKNANGPALMPVTGHPANWKPHTTTPTKQSSRSSICWPRDGHVANAIVGVFLSRIHPGRIYRGLIVVTMNKNQ